MILASAAMIIVNFIYGWNKMHFGFWGRNISLILLILAMLVSIRETRKNPEKREHRKKDL